MNSIDEICKKMKGGKAKDSPEILALLATIQGTRNIPNDPISTDELKTALVDRYLQAVEYPCSRADLERLLDEREVFDNAGIFMEYANQLKLILEELRRLAVASGSTEASDMSELGAMVYGQLLKFGQRLPLSLPQAVLEESASESKPDHY